MMKGEDRLSILSVLGSIHEEGLKQKPLNPKRRLLIFSALIIAAVLFLSMFSIYIEASDHPSEKAVLKASDLNEAQLLGTNGWEQSTIEVKRSAPSGAANMPSITPSIEWSLSVMTIGNSTANISLVCSIAEFSTNQNAREWYETFIQQLSSDSNFTSFNASDGSIVMFAMPSPYDNEINIQEFAAVYNGGNLAGTIDLGSNSMQRGDYSLLGVIADLQCERI